MTTAFLGYVLPWGQISFWGAAVITRVISAFPVIGKVTTFWVWGGPSISQPTLGRFFSLHYLTPILIVVLVTTHVILLHTNGSSAPLKTSTKIDKIKFHPLFLRKDLLPAAGVCLFLIILIFNNPTFFIDSENFNPANPLISPLHIKPEWYFLFAYAILRSVPSKMGGVLALISSILVFVVFSQKENKSSKFSLSQKIKF